MSINSNIFQKQEGGLRTTKELPSSIHRQPLISIITVDFNSEQYLEKTLLSVLEQCYKNYEYIIIDGGSQDETINIIKKYEKQIDYWISEPDGGIYDAMNKGIKLANGEVIGILNSGDLYDQNALEEVAELYSNYQNKNQYLIISGAMYRFDETANLQFLQQKNLAVLKAKINQDMPINHPATFVSKNVYNEIGNFDQSYQICGDYDFIFRAYNNSKVKFVFTDKILASMMMGGKSEKPDAIWTRLRENYVIRKYKLSFFHNLLISLLWLINHLSKHFLSLFFGSKIIMYKCKIQQKIRQI